MSIVFGVDSSCMKQRCHAANARRHVEVDPGNRLKSILERHIAFLDAGRRAPPHLAGVPYEFTRIDGTFLYEED